MANIEVTGINFYPIKSCAGLSVEEASLVETGLEYDRRWMLVDEDSKFLSQRKSPQLALVRPFLTDDSLVVSAPNMPDLEVPLSIDPTQKRARVPVTVWKKSGLGIGEGGDASDWFTKYLGSWARLIRIDHNRPVKFECRVPGAAEEIAFADGFPILLTSEQSLAALNEHLEIPVPMNRFRSNIVVSGEGLDAYDEDYWREIRIGNVGAYVVRACDRCPIPNIDQATGVRTENNPVTVALRATRRGRDIVSDTPGDFFGQNLVHALGGDNKIRVGESVTIINRAAERNFTPQV